MGELNTIRDYIDKIYDREIIIPNFQREYVWKQDDTKKLIASYFFKVKIGALLFYTDSKFISKSKEKKNVFPFLFLGESKVYNYISEEIFDTHYVQPKYVLDGQQRLTSTMIAFTTYFHDKDKLLNRFKAKYYLKIDLNSNIFGINEFIFKGLEIGGEISYYDFIENNLESSSNKKTLANEENDIYYLPLFNIYSDDRKVFNEQIDNMVSAIAIKRMEIIKRKQSGESLYSKEPDDINKKKQIWIKEFSHYLINLLDQELPHIVVKDNLLAAIKTYEIINKSGRQISDLDIIAAKYSSANNDSLNSDTNRLYDDIRERFKKSQNEFCEKIDINKLFSRTQSEMQNTEDPLLNEDWNFVNFILGITDEKEEFDIPNRIVEQLLKLIKYISLTKSDELGSKDQIYNINNYKSIDILEMSGEEVKEHLNTAIDSISKATLFLQIRCGLRGLGDLNYYWQLFVISVLIYENEENFIKKNDLVQAWYYLSRFSIRYRNNQNQRAIDDMKGLINQLEHNEYYTLLDQMLDDVEYSVGDTDIINTKELSKKSVLIKDELIEPYEKITDFIAEYCIRDGYISTIFSKNNKYLISTLTYPITNNSSFKLEKHHIIPLGNKKESSRHTTKETRELKNNPYNSALNFVYITSSENKYISTKTVDEYRQLLNATFTTSAYINYERDISDFLDKRYEDFFSHFYSNMKSILNKYK
jgi:hypothetical protein